MIKRPINNRSYLSVATEELKYRVSTIIDDNLMDILHEYCGLHNIPIREGLRQGILRLQKDIRQAKYLRRKKEKEKNGKQSKGKN